MKKNDHKGYFGNFEINNESHSPIKLLMER